MPKRFLIGLILFFAIAAGLYQVRIQLLTAAFNNALAQADIRLLQLEGLELGWDGVDVDMLVLGVGHDSATQILQGVHLAYSIIDVQPHSLAVKRAVLTFPADGEGQQDSNTPLLLSDILDQVLAGPLHSVDLKELEVRGFSSPALHPPVSLQARWEEGEFFLEAADRDKQLHLQLNRLSGNDRFLSVKLEHSSGPAIDLSATITRRDSRHHIEGAGQLWLDSSLLMLAGLVDLPEPLSAVSGDVLYQLSGELDDDLQALEVQNWELQLLPQTALEVGLVNADTEVSVQLSLPQPLIVTVQPGIDKEVAVSLAGRVVNWQLTEKLQSVEAEGELSAIQCQYLITLNCEAMLSLALNAAHISVPGDQAIALQNPSLQLSGKLILDAEKLSAELESGQWLSADLLTQGDIQVVEPILIANSAGHLQYRLAEGELSLRVDELQLGLPQVQMPELNVATLLQLQVVELSRNVDGLLNASARVHADAISLQRPDTWLPALSLDSTVELNGQRITFAGDVRGNGQLPLFNIAADYQLDAERGSARILAKDMTFGTDGSRLSQQFSYWPFEWDIFDGSLTMDLGLYWKNAEQGIEIQGEIKHKVLGVAGVYSDIGFLGLDVDFAAEIQSLDQLVTTRPATISLALLDVGVPIEAIKTRFRVDVARRELKIESAEAQLFDGRVWIEEATYRAGRGHNPIFIGVDGMQLDKLLQLAGYDAVRGTGTISGLLPLDVNEAGFTMKRGMLAAKAPGGVFSYQTEIVAGTNPAMVQVIEALRNYHYSIFQIEADYLENGDLVLAMVLRGSNPELQQGRPIHLNLNVTDNIPTLLRSLQSGRVIADKVSKKVGGSAR
ncbi:MAG: YdbH domain-containing protein [Proteobacteria bacterium]|nr:YdbH domain-containing protein [Pseudomonadota bacterium]